MRLSLSIAVIAVALASPDNTVFAGSGQDARFPTPTETSWWAWQPLERPTPPRGIDDAWVRNPIDQFILAQLADAGLVPAPPARKQTLIRRVTYDLTGLPPTPEDVEAFLNDPHPDAYERLVERLLASEQFGVKWARHWLDAVRFAETDGYERDRKKPSAWRFRDWVVNAINDDTPWDDFLRAQLAGDEVPDRDLSSLIATGYYRLGIWDDEPTDVEVAQFDDLDSIIDVTSRAMLGMSIACARCHDHKRDPIPQSDYYRLAAVFRDIKPYKKTAGNSLNPEEFVRSVPTTFGADDQTPEHAAFHRAQAEVLTRLEKAEASLTDIQPEPVLNGLLARHRFDDEPTEGRVGHGLVLDGDESGEPIRIDHVAPNDFTISFWFKTTAMGLGSTSTPRWFQGSGLVDGEIRGVTNDFGISMVGNGIIAAGVGNPETFIHSASGFNDGMWHLVALTRSRSTGVVRLFVDGLAAMSATGGTQTLDAIDELTVGRLRPGNGPFTGSIDDVRIHDRVLDHVEVLGLAHDLHLDPTLLSTTTYPDDIATLVSLEPPKREIIDALCAKSLGVNPVPTSILIRGNPKAPGRLVTPGVPVVLGGATFTAKPEPHNESPGLRLAFADWLTAGDNPVASRVAANQLWQHHFGRGIVRSSDDFGRLGERPTHPTLLDWLARELIANEWSMKAMHRLIVTSSAYRMSSVYNEAAFLADPKNDLFWRFDLRRLSGEELRDSILAVSGELNLEMGGPSVFPPLPAAVLATASRPNEAWGSSTPRESSRRSLYIFSKRSLRFPFLEAFDQPDTDRPCAVRFDTTVPTQSLMMLNSDFLNDQAFKMSQRLQREQPDSVNEQVQRGLELVLSRQADAADVRDLRDFIDALKTNDGLTDDQALEATCLLLLNLNEFLHVH